MIINCPECDNQISDKAVACPHCGMPMKSDSSNLISRKQRFHRLPKNFGQIKHLTDTKRRKPYMALPPTQGYNDKGKAIVGAPLGYFATYQEAYEFLTEWNKKPIESELSALTFAEVYERFMAEKFDGTKPLTKATIYSYRAPYNHCGTLYPLRYSDIRQEHFMSVLKACPLKHASLEFILNLFKQMDKYALQHDIIQKGYAQFCFIPIQEDDEHGQPFTEKELSILWANTSDKDVQKILVMCYSGFRISAYSTIKIKDGCFFGGIKTKVSKDRYVPIHPCIVSWAKSIIGIDSTAFRKRFKKKMAELGMNHTPHDCRHTFSWLLSSSGCDETTRRILLGHAIGKDVDANIYTHKTIEELKIAVKKIKCYANVT